MKASPPGGTPAFCRQQRAAKAHIWRVVLLTMGAALFFFTSVLAAPTASESVKDTQPAPSEHRSAIVLLRAVAYDSALSESSGTGYNLAVLFAPDDTASKTSAERMHQAFRQFSRATIQGRRFKTMLLPFSSNHELRREIMRAGLDALYVSPGLDSQLGEISAMAREMMVSTLAGKETYVDAPGGGVSIAAVAGGKKLRLLIDLRQSRAEGQKLRAELLRLAEIKNQRGDEP